MSNTLSFILVAILIFLLISFLLKFKFPKVGSIAVFTGGVKVGKSGVSLFCALFNYILNKLIWRLRCFFVKFFNLFRRKSRKIIRPEEPYFYSNIPLKSIRYVPLTRDHLLRKVRLRKRSVVYMDEASLVADSQLIKDKHINTQLLLFFKLFGHECGGLCVVNTHTLSDLHYALKRCTSQYFYIHHLSKYIPFFNIVYMREERYSEDNSTMNNYNEDVESSLKFFLMPKSIFKKYDCFCYSYLTDHLPYDTKENTKLLGKSDSLKANEIVSFRKEFARLATREDIENEKKDS